MTTFYIATAWIVTIGAIASYSAWLIHRGRKLSEGVPEDQRRWM